MSDNIPVEIQMEIIKKVSDVKSLIQFRSVSKPWKSFRDNYEFINGYTFLVDDDNNETFKVQQHEFAPFVVSPLLEQYRITSVVGGCHGLLCLYCYDKGNYRKMLVICNPSIRKSVGIVIPRTNNQADYGFRVYLLGCFREDFFTDDGESTINGMVVSFDLITKEFKVVNLPDALTNELLYHVSYFSKLRDSLVVSGYIQVKGTVCCGVWVMEHDPSFRNLFNIGASFYKILGFRKNGEPVFEIQKANELFSTLNVYDLCSQKIKNLGIYGVADSFFMGSYKESLLLLDHSDLHIYSDQSDERNILRCGFTKYKLTKDGGAYFVAKVWKNHFHLF
ncbi:hypothetical protein Tco_0156636 [Tanacetum coccineum]